MSLSLATAPEMELPPEVSDHFASTHEMIAAKGRAIADAEAELASIAAEDAELCTAITHNRQQAAEPEPQAVDFESLEHWHAAAREWRAEHAGLDDILARLERERSRILPRLPQARRKIAELRQELAQIELNVAKDELIVAERHVEAMKRRVIERSAALGAAGERAAIERVH